ncbi:hypothetical protein GQ53DRAFT_743913 [Thozetella sp. PMI_491]|nr:hypothetical protein GQ53DRAFT_743913 [Thozetella sp. PMI_491]
MAEEIRKENAITNADNSTERRARRASQSPLLSPQLPNESGLPSLVNQASLRAKSEWKEPESDALELTPKGPSHLPLSENGLAWLRHMPELTGAGHASPWLAMRRFLQRPYWKRIWIIQEAVLATRLYILCGTKSLSWDDLSLVCVQFGTPTKVLESIFDEFPHLRRLHLTHELFPLTSIRAFRYSRDVNFFSIFYVILMTSRAKATDPRDHIYGLLGIAKEFTAADYTRSVEDLYLEFSSRWIEWVLSAEFTSEESISLFSPLQRAGIGYRRNLVSLPSWVVDLTSLDDSGKRMYFTDYQACGQTSIESAGFTVRGRNLLLKGAVVDTISQTWEFGDEDAPVENRVDAKMLIGKRSRLVYDIMVKLANIHDDIDAEQLVRTTFMALMLGRYEPYDTRLEIGSSRFNHLFEGFELFSAVGFNLTNLDLPDDPQIALNVLNTLVAKASSTRRDPNLGDAFEPIWTFFQSHYERSFQQAIFITNEGRLGVGTRLTRQGDVVCIIPGHTNTFLLRPGGGEDYELVCPAYVQGLMDGEAVGEDVDAWLSTLQGIEIR